MTTFNTNSFNPLANLKVSVKSAENKSLNSSANSKINSANATNSTQSTNSNEVLGYKVDKDGYFTEEFNEKAGIPSYYKIYAKGAENLVNYISAHPITHTDIDFAKSLANVYKLFSQIAPETDGTSFSKEQIASLPVGFEYDTNTFRVIKTYNYEEMRRLQDYTGTEKTQFAQIFPSQAGTSAYLQGKPSEDIFRSNPHINIGAKAYKNTDGSVEKGGVLMAFFSARIGRFEGSFLEGKTSIRGKLAGLDASLSQGQLNDLRNFIEQNPIQYGFIDDLVASLRLKDSNLAIDDFKAQWLKLKEKSDKAQADFNTQETLNLGINSKANSAENQRNSVTAQENTEKNSTKKRSPIQVTSKSETYTNSYFAKYKNLLEDAQKMNMFEILFGAKSGISNNANSNGFLSSTSAFNTNGTDLNINLMNLNLSQIKLLGKIDIRA